MSYEVTYSEDTLLNRVVKRNRDQYRDDVVYQFSGGKQFLCTDRYDTGIYDGGAAPSHAFISSTGEYFVSSPQSYFVSE